MAKDSDLSVTVPNTELQQRKFQQVEDAQGCLPAANTVARRHIARTPLSGFEWDRVGLRIDLAEIAIDLFALPANLEDCLSVGICRCMLGRRMPHLHRRWRSGLGT
jgi:hypothetical protein